MSLAVAPIPSPTLLLTVGIWINCRFDFGILTQCLQPARIERWWSSEGIELLNLDGREREVCCLQVIFMLVHFIGANDD